MIVLPHGPLLLKRSSSLSSPSPLPHPKKNSKATLFHKKNMLPPTHLIPLLLLILISLQFSAAAASIYDVLRSHGLPIGLLPVGVRDFEMDGDGRFQARLDAPCTATFESDVRYNASIAGTISRGQIAGLSGISAQDLFLWFPVLAIRLDDNASGIIHFDVGVVDKRLPLSLFEDPPKCTPLASLGEDQSGELRQEIDRDAAKQTAI